MAFRDMTAEVRGWVAKLNLPLSQTLVNRALQKIYDESRWSFQYGEGAWSTPGLVGSAVAGVSPGLITVVLGDDKVIGDATAAAAWAAIAGPYAVKTMQIRRLPYSLYNIIDYEANQPVAGQARLTLDRPWMDPAGAGLTYMMYQAYYVAPVKDFRSFITVRDMTNAIDLDFSGAKQSDLAARDPQRTIFQLPTRVVPYRTDARTGSTTLGNMLYELWPHPLSTLPYQFYYTRKGAALVNPTDEIPSPLTEELVLHRTKVLAYEWAEANKSRYPELAKSNWAFLIKLSDTEYKERLKDIRKIDRDIADAFITKLRRNVPSIGSGSYSAVTGQASVGSF